MFASTVLNENGDTRPQTHGMLKNLTSRGKNTLFPKFCFLLGRICENTRPRNTGRKTNAEITVHVPSVISTVEGRETILECSFEDENPVGKLHVILWQKFDERSNKYRTVFNSQVSDVVLAKRIRSFANDPGNGSIVISSVLRSDTGTYRCQVTSLPDFEQSESIVELRVMYGPDLLSPNGTTHYVNMRDRVVLSCLAEGHPSNITYLWFHNGRPVTKTENDARYTTENNVTEGSFLTIVVLDSSKEGSYSCLASNAAGRVRSHHDVSIKRPVRFLTDESIIKYTVTEGNNVTIILQAHGMPSNISYHLLSRVESLYVEWDESNPGHVKFHDVSREQAGSYRFLATNGVSKPGEINVTLDVQYPPKFVERPINNYTLLEYSSVIIPCEATGNPSPIYKWTRSREIPNINQSFDDNSTIPTENAPKQTFKYNETSGSLQVSRVSRKDSGLYTCTVNNGIGGSIMTDTVLTIEYAPDLIQIPDKQYVVLEGTSINFTCIADGVPNVEYSWFKDYDQLLPGRDHQTDIISAGTVTTLTITNVTRYHEGIYRCQVINKMGMTFAETSVQVRFAPSIEKGLTKAKQYAKVGDTVKLQCITRGRPTPNVSWRQTPQSGIPDVRIFNGTRDNINIYESVSAKTIRNSTLEISKVSRLDYGIYLCVTENDIGEDTLQFEIKYIGKPPAPRNLKLVDVLENSVKLIWTISGPAYPAPTYYATIENVMSGWKRIQLCQTTRSCAIMSLNASSAYVVEIHGVNSVGRGMGSTSLKFYTKPTITEANTVTTGSIFASTAPTAPIFSQTPKSQEATSLIPQNNTIMSNSTSTNLETWNISINETTRTIYWDRTNGSLFHTTECILIEIALHGSRWRSSTPCINVTSGKYQFPVVVPFNNVNIRAWICIGRETNCWEHVLIQSKGKEPTGNNPRGTWLYGFLAAVVAVSAIVLAYSMAYNLAKSKHSGLFDPRRKLINELSTSVAFTKRQQEDRLHR